MKRIYLALLGFGLLLIAPLARAQNFTVVTATVTDPNGIPYSFGTVSAVLIPSSSGPWRLNGQPYSGQLVNTPLDVNGTFTARMGSNAAITPSGTQWLFTVNEIGILPPLGTGAQSFTATITISGTSQDISSTLNALAPKLTNLTGAGGSISLTGSSPIVVTPSPIVGTGVISCPTCSTSATPPGSPTGSLQWDNAGAFGGIADLLFNGSHTLTGGAALILDLSALTGTNALTIPVQAGASPVNSGAIAFDSTSGEYSVGIAGTSTFLPAVNGNPNGGNCTAWITVGSGVQLTDPGGKCLLNPMTTLGDTIFENSTPAPARLAGCALQVGVPCVYTTTPTTGPTAAAPAWGLAGVPINAQTGTTYAVQNTDRQNVVTTSNAGSIATSLAQAGSGNFTNNFNFGICNIGVGTNTITPTTSTINGVATLVIPTNRCAYIYSDNSNWFASEAAYGNNFPSGISGLTTGFIPKAGSATSLVNSACDDGITSASVMTCSETIATPQVNTTGAGVGTWQIAQGNGALPGVPGAGLINETGPATVSTPYEHIRVGAAATGIMHETNIVNVMTDTISPVNLAGADVTGILPNTSVAQTPVPAAGTSATLVGPREYFSCSGNCTITVPVPVAGNEFCVFNDDNVTATITLSALGSGAMYENTSRTAYGTAGTGTLSATSATANKVCIVGKDATHYWTLSFNGVWTAS